MSTMSTSSSASGFAPHLDTKGEISCPGGTAGAGYPSQGEIPFSAVSSFNYPAAVDASLLTPVSSPRASASPPNGNKTPPHATIRQPTPPATSRLYYSPFDMVPSSQVSSPNMGQVTLAEQSHFEDMATYLVHDTHSPRDDGAHHMDYFHFGVTGPIVSEPHDVSPLMHDYHNPFRPGAMDMDHPYLVRHHTAPVGTLNPTVAMSSSLHLQNPYGSPTPVHTPAPMLVEPTPEPPQLQYSNSRRQAPPRKRASSSKNRRGRAGGSAADPLAHPAMTLEENGEAPRLTLMDKAPEDDKFLFDLRRQFLHAKGKGMWEVIRERWIEKYGPSEKAALQMKISRAVCKFGVWPRSEEMLLEEAFRHDEEHRYARIISRMKELGGGQVWEWKPQHIEAKLVAMGLEEPTIDEKTSLRRRRKLAQRRRAATVGSSSAPGSSAASQAGGSIDWTNNGLHPHHAHMQSQQAQQHPGMHSRRPSYDMSVSGDELSIAPIFTSEQHDELLDQIHLKAEPDSSPAPDADSLDYDDDDMSRDATDINHQHSERVARQACEQLLMSRLP